MSDRDVWFGTPWRGSIVAYVVGHATRWILAFCTCLYVYELLRKWGSLGDTGVVAQSSRHVLSVYLLLVSLMLLIAIVRKAVDWVAERDA